MGLEQLHLSQQYVLPKTPNNTFVSSRFTIWAATLLKRFIWQLLDDKYNEILPHANLFSYVFGYFSPTGTYSK